MVMDCCFQVQPDSYNKKIAIVRFNSNYFPAYSTVIDCFCLHFSIFSIHTLVLNLSPDFC